MPEVSREEPLDGASTVKSNVLEIRRALDLLVERGQVAEIRGLHTKRATMSGYFDDLDKMAQAAASLSGKAAGVYITLNPLDPDLLARAVNRVKDYARETTADRDILNRRWLPFDFDAVRPAGISSTDAEHEAALDRARACRRWLTEQGWPEPIFADSGNGAHLLYRVELPTDDDRVVELCLKALAAQFDDAAVVVDVGNYNPARIWKVYGTLVAKGDSVPERPHRMARIVEGEALVPISEDRLNELAATAPEPAVPPKSTTTNTGKGRGEPFDIDQWIVAHGLSVARTKPWGAGRRMLLDECPFNPDHSGGDAVITQAGDGKIGFKCHHNSCEGTGWREVREHLEPGAYSKGGDGFGKNGRYHQDHDLASTGPARFTDVGNGRRFVASHGGMFITVFNGIVGCIGMESVGRRT